jgi:hypothetical protein
MNNRQRFRPYWLAGLGAMILLAALVTLFLSGFLRPTTSMVPTPISSIDSTRVTMSLSPTGPLSSQSPTSVTATATARPTVPSPSPSATAEVITVTLQPTANPERTPTPPRIEHEGRFSFFGIEMGHITSEYGLIQAREAGVEAIRNPSVSWKDVEPTRTDPPTYHWEVLEGLERELSNAAQAGIEVVLPVMFTPDWAQAVPGHSCGPISEDRLDEFAQFLRAVVERYSAPPYRITYWELFNEPDVDPSLVSPDSVFGCWGDQNDEYYGGRYFAQMLKQAYPAIKEADSQAQVILGGLLLDAPNTVPSAFLEGVLEGGGGDYFDVLAFHAYTFYSPDFYNWDTLPIVKWLDWGGVVVGKTRFLRQVIGRYGYDKPLFLNESGLMWGLRTEPPDDFRLGQADYVVKLYARGMALDLLGIVWYGWRGPGWRYLALLNEDLSPTPAYHALAFAIQQLDDAEYLAPTDYPGTEGYAFRRGGKLLQVVWSADGEQYPVSVPLARFRQALDPSGQPVPYQRSLDRAVFRVRRPIYIELIP